MSTPLPKWAQQVTYSDYENELQKALSIAMEALEKEFTRGCYDRNCCASRHCGEALRNIEKLGGTGE